MNKVNAIEMTGICKSFNNGKIIANHNMNFVVKKNEIHALVGENGAGKSTLMSILFGIYQPDSGSIRINGQNVEFKSANDAAKMKLGMVHQHFKLVPCYTLLENIILGAEKTKHGFLNLKLSRKEINKIAKENNLQVDLDTKTEKASVGEQQRTEILKLLYRENDILIFDEPTAVLSDKEIDGFLKLLKDFKKQGKTIVLITHKLDEVRKVADRATIIQNGKFIKTVNIARTSNEKIAELMIGRKVEKFLLNEELKLGEKPILEIKDLVLNKEDKKGIIAVNNISFNLYPGEVLGIAGIEGNGQTELALAIAGLLKIKSGEITINDDDDIIKVSKAKIQDLYSQKILSHVPEDRHKHGIILDESVAINCVTPEINSSEFSWKGILKMNAIRRYANAICNKWDVRGTSEGYAIARSLSGGNQQKLVLGREISRGHKIIVYAQPTRGLDIGAINSIHKKIVEDAKNGAAVLVVSYELDEILSISSRVFVMDSGKIAYESPREKINRKIIGQYLSRTVGARNV